MFGGHPGDLFKKITGRLNLDLETEVQVEAGDLSFHYAHGWGGGGGGSPRNYQHRHFPPGSPSTPLTPCLLEKQAVQEENLTPNFIKVHVVQIFK